MCLQVFSDITHFKLNKEKLDHQVLRGDNAVAVGGFGSVFKRILHTDVNKNNISVVSLRSLGLFAFVFLFILH